MEWRIKFDVFSFLFCCNVISLSSFLFIDYENINSSWFVAQTHILSISNIRVMFVKILIDSSRSCFKQSTIQKSRFKSQQKGQTNEKQKSSNNRDSFPFFQTLPNHLPAQLFPWKMISFPFVINFDPHLSSIAVFPTRTYSRGAIGWVIRMISILRIWTVEELSLLSSKTLCATGTWWSPSTTESTSSREPTEVEKVLLLLLFKYIWVVYGFSIDSQAVFGVRSSLVRERSAYNYIRHGWDGDAVVTVTMCNTGMLSLNWPLEWSTIGRNAYKHDLYGDKIIIERSIRKTSNKYLMKSDSYVSLIPSRQGLVARSLERDNRISLITWTTSIYRYFVAL